jgi:hypothetical protein
LEVDGKVRDQLNALYVVFLFYFFNRPLMTAKQRQPIKPIVLVFRFRPPLAARSLRNTQLEREVVMKYKGNQETRNEEVFLVFEPPLPLAKKHPKRTKNKSQREKSVCPRAC